RGDRIHFGGARVRTLKLERWEFCSSVGRRVMEPLRGKRELYIDAFRGLMALVMVQGHLYDRLLAPSARENALYQLQVIFHGSTAPGFLFASGFVAGLPRAPLSVKASLRRGRRLLFVLGVGYALQLPFLSLLKTLQAPAAQIQALLACNALHVIAVTQLLVLALQWIAGRRWTTYAGLLALAVIAAGPFVWSSGLAQRLPLALGPYLDRSSGSFFPVFPFSSFVLAGTVAGAALGRQEPATRRRRALRWGGLLIASGALLAVALAGRVDFWGVSPGYTLLRLGGLLLLLLAVELLALRGFPGMRAPALLGHETLLVYVLHLYLLYGGVLGPAPLGDWTGQLGFGGALGTLLAMIPLLLAAAWLWNRAQARAPREAQLALAFVTVAFVFDFVTRPW